MFRAISTTTYLNLIQFLRSQIYLNILAGGLVLVLSSWIFSELVPQQALTTLVDIGLAFIPLLGALLAISLGILSVSKEIENKSIHSYLASPMPRYVFVLAKFSSLSILVLISNLTLGLILLAIYKFQGGEHGAFLLFSTLYVSLETFIMVALTLLFAYASSSTSSLIFITLTFIMGRLLPAFAALIDSGKFGELMSQVLSFLYLVLPQFFRFDLTAWVESRQSPSVASLFEGLLYAVVYIILLLIIAVIRFKDRDLK